MIDLLRLAVDLEAIGATPEISDGGDPTLCVSTPALTWIVYPTGHAGVATNDGGSTIVVPGIDTDIAVVIARHAERMRPAMKAA